MAKVRTDRQFILRTKQRLPALVGRAGCWIRSSYKGRTANALALEAEEGRGHLR